jgi:similar to stage IV sporulation protein
MLSADTVWDIRISGNGSLSEQSVLLQLESAGVGVGKRWSRIDKGESEATLLSASPDIGWVNINRRGSVAYVEIIEKSAFGAGDVAEQRYSNVIAERDCVIEKISVRSGCAAVKVGDTVKKGDVLIIGVNIADGAPCRADGEVVGRSWQTLTVEKTRKITEKEYINEKKTGFSIKIFEKIINIYKTYGNSNTKCDIIVNNDKCTLFGKYTLPISFIREYSKEYRTVSRILTDGELTEAARMASRDMLASLCRDAELLSVRSEGRFTDKGYEMITYTVWSLAVGVEIPYDVE